jgi:hypothetical protein
MSQFDQAARYTARRLDAAGFLRWALGAVWGTWRWAGWLDTQGVPFPGEPERRSDTVAVLERVAQDGPPAAVVIEFQSRPQGDMLERLAEYVLRLRRELPYQRQPLVPYEVIGVLLNLTGPPQTPVWAMRPPDFGEVGLQFQARVLTLREEDALGTLGAIARGQVAGCLLPWVPLMRGADQAAVVAEWRRVAAAENDPGRRGDYGGLARVFAELAGRVDVWTAGLEGWNMEVSKVITEWQQQALARGRAEGRVEGLAEGRAEVLPVLRAKLLRAIQVRLNVPPPPDLIAAVEAQSDPATLDRWFDAALSANTLAEVRSAFNLP